MSNIKDGNTYTIAPCVTGEDQTVMPNNETDLKKSGYSVSEDTEMTFQCTECGYSTQNLENFHAHMIVHQDSGKDTSKAFTNGQEREDKNKLYTSPGRKLTSHDISPSCPLTHKCSLCAATYQSSRGLKIHMIKFHYNGLTSKTSCAAEMKTESVTDSKPLHMCTLCHYTTRNFSFMEIHLKKHIGQDFLFGSTCQYTDSSSIFKKHRLPHDKLLLCCKECDYKCKHPSSFMTHLASHAVKEPYKCDFCDFSALIPSTVKRHQKIHIGDRPYQCTICNYSFKKSDHLKKHMRTHSTDVVKPYTCDICSFASPDYGQLKRHMRCKHTDDRPFKCGLCLYASARSSDLSKHMERHLNEKQYKCPMCDFASNSSSSLHVHVRTHSNEKPYRCGVCDYTCRESSRLKQHMMSKHLPERPFKCDKCSHSYIQLHTLKKHKLTHLDEKSLK